MLVSIYAMVVGLIAGFVALGVLDLIYLFTNIFFSGHWSFKVVYPDGFHLGAWVIFIPLIGGLAAGLMIHYWEPTLKGHGTPEVMESVLVEHSVLRLRVGVLKPILTALVIGTGGPFGAEGPIIQTGGVIGSFLGQHLRLSPYERRILLAGGAAAGLAATFLSPLAGVLLAIELLLFEFSARSFIPVALATAVATGVAKVFRGTGPLFPGHAWQLKSIEDLWLFGLLGIVMGVISVILIRVLFRLEDLFDHFPLKPASIWAPVIGALIMGCIGYFFPHTFGTGYDTIAAMLSDHYSAAKALEISGAKFWAMVISLGSGTTGGVFAPSLIIGGGFGAAFGAFWHHFLPQFTSDPAAYSLAGMGALFAGSSRAPITSVVFMLELSHNTHAALPLIVACFIADLFTRLFSVDSIMTGKLHKRGLMVFQDYSTPVLVGSQIGQVVRERKPISAGLSVSDAAARFSADPGGILAVTETDGKLAGILEVHDLLREDQNRELKVRDVVRTDFIVAKPDDLVPIVSQKMLAAHANNVVVEDGNSPIGVVGASDLLRLERGLAEKHLLTSLRPFWKPHENSGPEPEKP